ncbi:MAG: MaoC family dehydratase [Methylobacteriaceae bacterium]|nr:MaoC family dehydratase [Methylobacteriaceae bacterium]
MASQVSPSAGAGRCFEDFRLGQTLRHATPRTVTAGDVALWIALYGSRFAVQCSTEFAQALGYPASPLDDLLVFNLVFGRTVADVSQNAIANLGYAACRFLVPAFPGDTLSAVSDVIGLRETSGGEAGVVYVRTRGMNQHGAIVLDYVRWVMVGKREPRSPKATGYVPDLPQALSPNEIGGACPPIEVARYDTTLSGSPRRWGDYAVGEKIDHCQGMTVEEAEHQMATRLYQNSARVHFDQLGAEKGRFGRRLVYGGHVMSLARSLSFNGLENAFHVAGINAGHHVAPLFAGSTVFAWSEVLEKAVMPDRHDVGAMRLRTTAAKDRPCADHPGRVGEGYDPAVILDLDYWVLMPR